MFQYMAMTPERILQISTIYYYVFAEVCKATVENTAPPLNPELLTLLAKSSSPTKSTIKVVPQAANASFVSSKPPAKPEKN